MTRQLTRVSLCIAASMVAADSAVAVLVTDYSNFSESGNMLNSGSHNREQDFAVSGSSVTISSASRSVGSAGQEIFGSSEFATFNSPGMRFELTFDGNFGSTRTGSVGSSDRFGLMLADAIPAGGPSSSDVRTDAGGLFVWGIRSGNALNSYLYTESGTETNADAGHSLSGADLGIYMEYTVDNGGGWNLGYIDSNGDDQFVQFRNTVNGTAIDTTGVAIGLYSDMRADNTVISIGGLSFGGVAAVPEASSALCFGLVTAGVFWRRSTRRRRSDKLD